MIEQYVVPLLINSVEPLEKMIWPRIIERVLKLSVRIPSVFLSLSVYFFPPLPVCRHGTMSLTHDAASELVHLAHHVLRVLSSVAEHRG